jgi:hypothetical protein
MARGLHDRRGKMHKIWFGVALAALIAGPASAQDYNRNLIECLNEIGLHPDPSYTQKLQSDPGHRTLRMWYPQSEAQFAVVNDCVLRKARLAPKPSAKKPPHDSR